MSWWKLWISIIGVVLVKWSESASAPQRPNIVFILADDLGWNDVSFHGSKQIPTPNLDALAYDGVILANYYVQPLCTPTRAALMTGRYPIRVGLQHYVLYSAQPYGLLLNQTIMPSYLKKLGYDTHIIGKWHLGFFAKEYTPTHRGFDSHFGYYQGCEDYWDHTYAADGTKQKSWGLDFRRDDDVVKTAFGEYSTELFTQEAEKVINEHDKSKPLYLYMAHQAVHSGNSITPLEAPWKYFEKMAHIKNPNRRLYAAMLSALDDSVGNITKALYQRGMLENTIIVFSTDNGGAANGFDMNDANNWPLRGLKATLWEGGVHGTGFIWSPLLEKSGYISQHLLHVTDWLPTLLHAAGFEMSELPPDLDGRDQWDAISHNKDSMRTEILLNIDQKENSSSIRSGDMKLVFAESGYTPSYSGWWPPDQIDKYFYGSVSETSKSSKVLEDCDTCEPKIKLWKSEDELKSHLSKIMKSYGVEFETEVASHNLHHSDIYRLLQKIGRDSSKARMGRPFVISCGTPPANASTNCKPQVKPCLYNVTSDPCEFYNLADGREETVRLLQEKLKNYEKESLPPYNVPVDDAGLPYRHNGIWMPWRNLYENSETEDEQNAISDEQNEN